MRKLALSRETLRLLDAGTLAHVQGGGPPETMGPCKTDAGTISWCAGPRVCTDPVPGTN